MNKWFMVYPCSERLLLNRKKKKKKKNLVDATLLDINLKNMMLNKTAVRLKNIHDASGYKKSKNR